MIEESFPEINKLRKRVEEQIPILESEIDLMIKNKINSPRRIENILDTLLSYSPLGFGEEQFKKFNNYYKTVELGFALQYEEWYMEDVEN